MPNDQFGRAVNVGDAVVIKGSVTHVLDNPNYLNCTVQLAQQLPPAGSETQIQLNTAQLELDKPGEESKSNQAKTEEAPPLRAHMHPEGKKEK